MQQAGTRRGAAAAKLPPFFCQSATGKIRTALSPGALYPPFNVHCKFPYYQLVVVYVPTVTVALPKIVSSETCFLPKSLLEISNRGGGDGPVNFLSTLKGFTVPDSHLIITFIT